MKREKKVSLKLYVFTNTCIALIIYIVRCRVLVEAISYLCQFFPNFAAFLLNSMNCAIFYQTVMDSPLFLGWI